MKIGKKSILFLGHEAYRTGGSLLLLNLIKWIYSNRDVNLRLILLDGGPLLEEFQKYAEVRVLSKKNSIFSMFQKLELKLFIQNSKPDLVYFNTVVSLKFYQRYQILFSSFRKVLHVHEMPFSISELAGNNLKLEDFDNILVVNKIIRNFFIKSSSSIPDISLITEYIDVNELKSYPKQSKIDSGKKVVLGVGVASWRKGFDLFLQTAAISYRLFPDEIEFIWVGPISNQDRKRTEYDIQLLGLNNSFKLVGESKEVYFYFQNSDLLFLSSREDPFPLVMLEAAVFRLPVIYFQGTGGAEEFFNYKDFEIPFGDCRMAAERIKSILGELKDHELALDQFQRNAFECDMELVIPIILKSIGFDD